MHLLQLCNVGKIMGGTAACAWSITRALPQHQHTVVTRSHPTDETRQAFDPVPVCHTSELTIDLRSHRPDCVILHNITPGNDLTIHAPTLQYVHSSGRRAAADLTVYCSEHIAQGGPVLYQGVPKPPRPEAGDTRKLRPPEQLVIGRICTPTANKWPLELIGFYERLATQHTDVTWEFVGCPKHMEKPLARVCKRACFHAASWTARSLLWRWDALLYHHPHVTESFGRTAAEAMRAGCIPIVDARGGFLEQFEHHVHGLHCKNAGEFELAVAYIQHDRRRRMSDSAQAHADQRYSLARFGANLSALLPTRRTLQTQTAAPA